MRRRNTVLRSKRTDHMVSPPHSGSGFGIPVGSARRELASRAATSLLTAMRSASAQGFLKGAPIRLQWPTKVGPLELGPRVSLRL